MTLRWSRQSRANPSLPPNSLLTREDTGNLSIPSPVCLGPDFESTLFINSLRGSFPNQTIRESYRGKQGMNSAKQGYWSGDGRFFCFRYSGEWRCCRNPCISEARNRSSRPDSHATGGGRRPGDSWYPSARGLSSSSRRASAVAAPRQLPAMRRRLNQLLLYRRPAQWYRYAFGAKESMLSRRAALGS
jgi:hypothetical protein